MLYMEEVSRTRGSAEAVGLAEKNTKKRLKARQPGKLLCALKERCLAFFIGHLPTLHSLQAPPTICPLIRAKVPAVARHRQGRAILILYLAEANL